ncbi:hypothetical protein LCGC14_1075890 [marine sediment metagenome]|uniref:Uncharacterized protein n=1 Tax=marine sediment metagenome TaxID=412755 RepID=A0A0F9QMJ2_9ZZZZ
MSWEIESVVQSRQNIYRVIVVEKDTLDELTGESVSFEYNEKEGFPALQAKILNIISEKKQKVDDKESKLTTYQSSVSLASAVDIKGGS